MTALRPILLILTAASGGYGFPSADCPSANRTVAALPTNTSFRSRSLSTVPELQADAFQLCAQASSAQDGPLPAASSSTYYSTIMEHIATWYVLPRAPAAISLESLSQPGLPAPGLTPDFHVLDTWTHLWPMLASDTWPFPYVSYLWNAAMFNVISPPPAPCVTNYDGSTVASNGTLAVHLIVCAHGRHMDLWLGCS